MDLIYSNKTERQVLWQLFCDILQHASCDLSEKLNRAALPHVLRPTLSTSEIKQLNHPYFLALIKKHRIVNVFYNTVTQRISPAISGLALEYLKPMKVESLKNSRQYLLQKACLLRVEKIFKTHFIEYIVMKGVALQEQLFGRDVARSMKDIDIIIDQPQFLTVHQLLLSHGFAYKMCDVSALSPKKIRAMVKIKKDLTYVEPRSGVFVELHWRVQLNSLIDFSGYFGQRTQQVVYSLSDVDNFIYLMSHAGQHSWFRLKWLLDLALFVQQVDFDWYAVTQVVIEKRLVRPFFELKLLLQQFFSIEIPSIPINSIDRFICRCRLRWGPVAWQHPICMVRTGFVGRAIAYFGVLFDMHAFGFKPMIQYVRVRVLNELFHRKYKLE